MNGMQIRIDERVVAININRTYRSNSSAEILYDNTRGIWRLRKSRVEKAQYAFAIYKGVIKEVYEIDEWYPAGSTKYLQRRFTPINLIDRYEFTGKLASDEIRNKYVGRTMPEKHSQNPIRYYNC